MFPFGNRKRSGQPTVLVPGPFLSWLGIDESELARDLNELGLSTESFIPENIYQRYLQEPSGPLGTQLDPLSLYPACTELECTPAELAVSIDGTRVLQEWTDRIASIHSNVEATFDRHSPSAILIIQGYEPANAVGRRLALSRDIPVLAIENTALNDRLVWDDISAITTNRNQASLHYWRHQHLEDPIEVEKYAADCILKTKERKSSEHQTPDQAWQEKEDGKKTIVFLGQVYTDSSIVFGLGNWPSPVDAIRATAEAAIRDGHRLIVKLHPKENSGKAPASRKPYDNLTWRKILTHPELAELIEKNPSLITVDYDNTYDTYSLLAEADVAITMNSQAGLEAAIRGVPTIVCGEAFFGGCGFTASAPCRISLQGALTTCLALDDSERVLMQTQARTFWHIYFEKFCLDKSSEAVAKKLVEILP